MEILWVNNLVLVQKWKRVIFFFQFFISYLHQLLKFGRARSTLSSSSHSRLIELLSIIYKTFEEVGSKECDGAPPLLHYGAKLPGEKATPEHLLITDRNL